VTVKKHPVALDLDGVKEEAVEVELRLGGLLSLFWKSSYWFRRSDKALPIFHAAGIFPWANLGLNRMIGGEATAQLNPLSFRSADEYLEAFYHGFKTALGRFYSLVWDLGFTMVNTCYPMSISEEELRSGLSAVYAATALDAVVCFPKAERAVLYKSLLDTIPAYRDRVRIFSPLSSIYMLHRHYSETDRHPGAFSCRGGVDFFFIDANDGNTYPCGYRGHENLGKFWQLDISALKPNGDCLRCDWECFRDPSELCAPLLQAFHRPQRLARRLFGDKHYFRLWADDIRYYYACGFFDARRPPDRKRLSRFRSSGEMVHQASNAKTFP
jgi:hypothetical protein